MLFINSLVRISLAVLLIAVLNEAGYGYQTWKFWVVLVALAYSWIGSAIDGYDWRR